MAPKKRKLASNDSVAADKIEQALRKDAMALPSVQADRRSLGLENMLEAVLDYQV